jgi:hypothetical protein
MIPLWLHLEESCLYVTQNDKQEATGLESVDSTPREHRGYLNSPE